jgi:VIT1/CCC1 family predicted Fe2+/Mn2+ transporter
LLFAGVGVVPMAFVAALFHAEWAALLSVVLGIILTFATRFLGIRLTTIPPQEETLPDYYDVQ